MERWQARGRFFRQTIVGDFLLPPICIVGGIGGLIALTVAGVDSEWPYISCVGLVTVPTAGVAAEALKRKRPPDA